MEISWENGNRTGFSWGRGRSQVSREPRAEGQLPVRTRDSALRRRSQCPNYQDLRLRAAGHAEHEPWSHDERWAHGFASPRRMRSADQAPSDPMCAVEDTLSRREIQRHLLGGSRGSKRPKRAGARGDRPQPRQSAASAGLAGRHPELVPDESPTTATPTYPCDWSRVAGESTLSTSRTTSAYAQAGAMRAGFEYFRHVERDEHDALSIPMLVPRIPRQ